MREVTLARYWNPGNSFYKPGDVVEVEDSTADWLERTGAVQTAVQEKASAEVRKPATKPSDEAPVPPETPAEVKTEAERPARTASIDAWREYAEKQGISTKGLTKAELISATK